MKNTNRHETDRPKTINLLSQSLWSYCLKVLTKNKILPTLLVCFILSSCANSSFVTRTVKKVFDKGGVKANNALENYTPSNVTVVFNEQYDSADSDALCDVYFPEQLGDSRTFPLIVWIHGGAWVAGSKDQMANYCRMLASSGYVVAAVNYSLAPNKRYPAQIAQVNSALAYLLSQSKRFHVDTAQVLIGGDSAGAQLAAQLGNAAYLSSYADLLGITPALQSNQLKGLILFCGAYDLNKIKMKGLSGSFSKNVLRSYSGVKDFMNDSLFATVSVHNYITKNYPPAFISVGNSDPLQEHSYGLAQKLSELGVKTDTLFFEKDYRPKLPHEYQFNLDTEAGKIALKRTVDFIRLQTQ